MKGKKLIVIMAIVILIFTIQASCALDDDNDFNLTQTIEIDDVNINDDDLDNVVTVINEDDSNSSDVVNLSSDVLGVSEDDVLSGDIHITSDTSLQNFFRTINNAPAGSNVFLHGLTFTGSASMSGKIERQINIYGGSSVDDPTHATVDFTYYNRNRGININTDGITITGVDFINYEFTTSYSILLATGADDDYRRSTKILNCSFINNTVSEKGYLVKDVVGGSGCELNNCYFENNTASVIVCVVKPKSMASGSSLSFIANNNTFINNYGTISSASPTNSLGLCFKINGVENVICDNNVFINNSNAAHGSAYCINAKNVVVSNNYIENNKAVYGAGIEAHLGFVQVYNTTFVGNGASGTHNYEPTNRNDRNGSGAAISFLGPNNYMHNCTFINNTAENYAGAIDIRGDNTVIEDCYFFNNTAQSSYGGAVNVLGKYTVIRNCTFDKNYAVTGGAVYLYGVNVTVDDSTFNGNEAVTGAAVFIEGFNATVISSEFEYNDATHNVGNGVQDNATVVTAGGAIYIKGNKANVVDNTFKNNTADGNYANLSGFGGALYIEGGDINFHDCNFTDNWATLGGAVYIMGDDIGTSTLNFTNNRAVAGGAIYIKGDNITIDENNFTENIAVQGGAVHIDGGNVEIINSVFENNNATRAVNVDLTGADGLVAMGGAIHVDGNNVEIHDNRIIHNTAVGTFVEGGLGGGISVVGANASVYDNEIHHNDAIRGGAIYIQGANATIKDMIFYTNNAVRGGAIYVEGIDSNITGNMFYDNNATHSLDFPLTENLTKLPTRGGAIYVEGNDTSITYNNFTYNAAIGINTEGGYGGAIYVKGLNANITENIFNENEAILGGAIYVSGTNATIADENFTNNNAIRGGAIYAEGINTTLTNLEFKHNNATHILTYALTDEFDKLTAIGGAVYVHGNNTSLENIKFHNNTAYGVNRNGGLGGAVAIDGYSTLVRDVEFIDNQAIVGGALYINGTLNSINYTKFTNNSAIRGGAVYNVASDTTIIGSEFYNNSATHELRFKVSDALYNLTTAGGAVGIHGDNVNVSDCMFVNNTAFGIFENGGLGGAIGVNGSNNYIYNSTFIGNDAINGGAFYLEGDSTLILSSNFTDNKAIKGGAGYIDGENSSIEESNFIDNDATHDLRFTLSDVLKNATTAGGAVFITGNNVNVSSSNFEGNDAEALNENVSLGGGAFYIEGNNANISDSSFTNNTALKGGAIFIAGNDTAIYDSNFTQNSVTNFTVMEGFGGAVYLEGSHNSDLTRCRFINNTASINGGAVDWHEGATGGQINECVFENNTASANGGAVFWFGQGGIIKDSNFTNNKAEGTATCLMGNSGDGGAIMWTGSDGTVDNCNFIDNEAANRGGAVFLRGVEGRAECDNNSFINSNFENNVAGTNGGAVDWHEGATNGTIEKCTFDNNTAKANGGAVFWYGHNGAIVGSNFTNNKALGTVNGTYGDAGEGGAVIWTGSNGLADDCIFINNTAAKNGGAVYLRNLTAGDCDNTVFSNSHFENNSAGVNGGAIDWHEGATNGAIVNSTFVNNSAKANGGAVFWYGTNGTISGSNFTDNRALGTVNGTYGRSGEGGAVIWTGSNGIVDDCTFVNNTAAKNGGAVYLDEIKGGCDNTTFSNSHFENNTAGVNGGAIDWHEGATNGRIENSTFVNNTAKANGGAVFWYGHNGTIAGSNFTDNRALGTVNGTYGSSGEGGAVIWTGSDGLVDECNFINNTAAKNGGAVYLRNLTAGDCDNTVFSNSHFENNSAGVNGGAIDWHEGATNGAIVNSTFVNNSAKANGGAVFWYGTNGTISGSNFTDNRALGTVNGTYGRSGEGGAVIWTGSNGIVDDCTFVNNTAAKNGGAVYLDGINAGCDNTTFSNSHFENNTAGVNGGAIDWHEGATNGAIENCTFDNNTAKANGGAVFWFGTNGTISGSNFTDNRALGTENGTYGRSGEGGAVIWTGSNGIVDDCTFVNNTAAKNGGAVYLDEINGGCDNTTFKNSHFENNTAGVNGGAIDWHEGATNGAIEDSTFVNNSAKANGGAVFWYGTNGTISGSNFTDNKALGTATGTYGSSGEGGAVIWTGSNGLVDDCNFINNTAANNGGAVYLRNLTANGCDNTTFANSRFIDNSASNEGGAIDWNEGATNGAIINSTFENNTAKTGGAVSWKGHDGRIENSNFTSNNATESGGAVYWSGINGEIDNSNFINNTAMIGGAVNLEGSTRDDTNVTINDSYFENNTADFGGAVSWTAGRNVGIEDSTFVNNTATYDGGAVFVNSDGGNIKNSEFISNEAAFGGAVYLAGSYNNVSDSNFTENAAVQGGAVYAGGSNNVISGSTFDNNSANYDLRIPLPYDVRTAGGAVLIRGENTRIENSKFYNNTAKTNREYSNQSNDPSLTHDGLGGAVYVLGNNANVTSSEFNDNRAVNGSAVYNDASNTLLDNDTFIKNQAWSYILNASAVPNSTYYGTSIKMSVENYTGGDNIINGVYNAGDVNDIVFNEVTYIVNNDESQTRKTKSMVSPVLGADEAELYQDSRERYQEITFEIINNETGKVVMTKTVNTDLYGNYSFDVSGLKPGNYTLKAYHMEDRNYKAIQTQTAFEIIDYVDLNITKEVSSYYTIVGNNVTFTIAVSNAYNATNATDVTIKDFLPTGLVYLDIKPSKGTFNETTNVWTIDKLENGTGATLTLVFNTTQIGEFNNTVNVTCSQDEWNYTNNNATVYFEVIPFNLTISKVAGVSGNISVGDEVTFTINITNNAKVNATQVIVMDEVPYGFEFVGANVTGYDSKTGLLTIPVIEAGKSYAFNITLKAVTNGTLTNVVNVTCSENTTYVNDTADVNVTPVVNLTVEKIVDYDDALIGDNVTFTIIITNRGPSNATNIIVKDELPTGLKLLEGELEQVIGFLASGNSTNVTIKVTNDAQNGYTVGTYTNWVYVNCTQNDTVKSANASVTYYNTDIKINKTVDIASVYIGEYFNFTISIKNHGTGNATNINITDVLDARFKVIETNGTNISKSVYKVGKLLSEETYSFWIYVQALNNGTITNTAYVNCTEEGNPQDASVTVEVLPIVKLAIEKTVNVTGPISTGKLVNFTINVTNNGISNATGVEVTDIIPDGFVFVGTNATGYDNATGILTVPLIKPGENYVFNITMKIVKAGTLTNTANATCAENGTYVNSSASVEAEPIILTVNKTANITLIGNNTLVKFTIVVNNTSVFEATGVVITDIVPDGFVAVSASAGNVTEGQKITWNIATLASGANATYWIVARSNATGTWDNKVNVTCNENETVVSDNATVEVVDVIFDVNKTANVTKVGNNTLVNFTIVVKNTARVNATVVVISDILPDGFAFVNATEGYIPLGQKVSWAPITILSGKNATYWIVARSNATGIWDNKVNVTSKENSTIVSDNATVEVVDVNLTISKVANITKVGNNTLVKFTITVNNTAGVNATNVNVTDMLPDGFEFVSASAGNITYGQKVTWIIDVLENNTSAELWIVARSNATGIWDNKVNATCKENDTVVYANATVEVVDVNLTISKVANITKVGNNTLVNFTIVVKNTASVNATGVKVSDVLPDGFAFVNATEGYIPDGQKVSWAPITLISGANATYWIVARSNATGPWDNKVKAISAENSTEVKANATVEVVPIVFTVNKTANITLVGNNTLVNFTIVVNMTSSINASDVVVCDKLPDGFALESASAGYNENGQFISWNFPKFSEKSITLWIVARSNATGTWNNVVNVTSKENKTLVQANKTVRVVDVNATIVKMANESVVGNNSLVNFTITVNHTSIVNATGVFVIDKLPVGFTFVNATEGYAQNGSEVLWDVGTLAPGQNLSYWIVARSVAIDTWNNTVSVRCNENKKILEANATVEVVPVNATIIKKANVTLVGNNTLVNFTIIVNNTSRANATNVIVSDELPNGFAFVNATSGYNQNGQEVKWNAGTVRSGETISYWIVAKSVAMGLYNNVVNVSCDQNTTLKANATVEVVPMNATINKTANITKVGNNTLVNFTIAVNNIARINATDVTITDVLPKGLTYVSSGSAKLGEGKYAVVNGREVVVWNVDTLKTSEIIELWIVAKSAVIGNWTNIVDIKSHENDTMDSANDTVEVIPVNLTVTKIADSSRYELFDLITYTINVTNNAGMNATEVVISDVIDLAKFNITQCNASYVLEANKLTWNLSTLKVGESYTISITVKALTNGTFTNTVNVTSKENQTVVSDNVTVTVIPIVNLKVTKKVVADKVGLNDYAVFTINITNDGPSDATDVRIIDALPYGLDYIDSTLPVFSQDEPTIIPLIKAGGSVEFNITALAYVAGNFTNVVNVTCAENDTVISANASVEVKVVNVTVVKYPDFKVVGNNSLVNYTIVVSNNDDIDATNVYVRDVLPTDFELVNATEGWSVYSNDMVWYFDKISKDSNVTIWILVKPKRLGNITNDVIVNYDENNNETTTNSTVEVVPVVLKVNKTSNVYNISIGDEVTFTVNITNTARINVTEVNVTDIVPKGFEFVSSSAADYDNKTGLLTIPVIGAGESYVFTITLKAVLDGILTNIVNVTCAENATYVNDTEDVNVTPIVILTVEKVVDSDDATIGDVVTFTITVTNNGPSNATDVRVWDILDNELELISGKLETVIPFLAAGNSTEFIVKAKTTVNGTYMNLVNVNCAENDTVKSANASVYVYNTDLKINKTTADVNVFVGDNVNFTIVIKNHGKSNATDIRISDVLDDAFEFVDANGTYTRNNQSIVWTVDRLANETSYSVWIVVKALSNGTIANVAHVNCSEEETVKNSTSNVTVKPVVNLTVVKTADVDTIPVSGEVTFTINVTNNGPSDATGVNITDAVPLGFEFVKSSAEVYDNATGLVTVPFIKANESFVFTITLKAVTNGTLTNVVNVTCNENTTYVNDTVDVNVTPVVVLTVEKVADSDDATIGDVVTFTITVTNNGPSNATNVKVTDILDKELNWISGDLEMVIPFLASGNSTEIIIKAQTTANGTYMNHVNVSCAENDTVKSAYASVHVYNTDLKINKTADVSDVKVGDIVNFTITIKNHGKSNATHVEIIDVLDGAFRFAGANGTYMQSGNSIVWIVPNLANEVSYSVWIAAEALTNGTFNNTAHVDCSEESTVKNSTTTVNVDPVVKLTVTKTVDADVIEVNGNVIFTINVTNNGPSNATGVNITDAVPAGFEFVESSAEVYDNETGLVAIPLIKAGDSFVFTITLKAVTNGTLTNVVNVTCNENNTYVNDTVDVNVTPVVVLTVEKVADSDDATIGDVVTFTITVTNNGPSDATDIKVIDILDKELEWVSGDLEMVIPFLASGNSANITVKAMTTANGTYMNRVNVSCAENDTVKSANASVYVYNTDLKINKAADVSDVKVGDVVNFTITIKNHGKSNATGINISDVLDGAFEFVDANGTYVKSGSSIVWTLDKLASEDSYSVWIAVKALINGTFNNTAHVDCNEETTLKNSTSTVNVDPVVKLTVTKTVDADVIEVNGNVIFTINVTNNGPSNATGVNITDAVPAGFEFVESSAEVYDNETGLVAIPFIKAGDSFVFTITLKAVTNGTLTNVVNVTCNENNTYVNDTVDVNVTPVVVLTVKKVADSDDATIGDVVTFTITVTNNGPSDATDIRLIDILDEELYWISGDLEMVIPFLASGNSANITVKAMTTANGTYMNHVNVSCAENGTVKSANASVHVYNTDLKIDKTADVSDVKVGDIVNFTITIKNHGRSNATGINISDVLDGAFEFVDANGTYAKSGSSIVWTLDKLASEDSYSVWIAVKALTNGTFNNTAHVDCNEETTLKNSTSTVNVDPVVNLTVKKTVDADVIEINGNVIFTINVTNNGPSNATCVNITDAVPQGFEFIESSDAAYDNETGLLTIPLIKAGDSFVFTVTLKAVTDGVLTNIVNVTCSENGTYVNDTVDVNVTPVVNLTVRKVADSDDATIGDVVTFTITVTNNGPSNATNIKVADIIGKEFSVIEGELNHVIAFLASGDSADIVIRMKTNTNGTLTNYVNVSCDENDTVKSANASVHVYNTDLKIDKTANVSDVKVGDLVNFTVTVKNHDLSNATNVHITDELDSAFEFIDASGSYTRNNNTVVWNVNRLAGEETVSVWIVVKALTNGTFANTAHVNCSEEETVKNSTTKVNVRPAVNLTVEKTADKATVEITGEVTFTINVTNNGPSDATCINVSDAVPTGFEFVKSNDSAYDDKTGILTIPLIKSGESYVFTITLKTIADGVLTNVVNVTCSENDTVKGSNASVNVTPVVILTVEKVADTDDATVGDVITFTITVTNNGPSNATNVRVTDVLDSGLELAGGETVIVIKFLESGDSANFTVKARTTAEGTYMNRVSVSCAENGTVKSANASVHVYNTDLKITKTTADTNVSVNDNVNFTITIKNHGKANATNIHISDILDGAFEFVNANGTYARNGQSIVWTVDKLASEASYSVWIVAKALSNGTFTNVAHVNCSEEETVKNSSATVDVKPVVNLTVKKTADVSNVSIGHEITYTINVTNNGPSNATNVVVKDELPEGLELVEGNLTTVIDLLQSGKSYIITVKAKAVSAGNLTNIVTARCDENTEEVTSNATVVANNPQMSANKTANDKFVYSGNQTSFTIKITNDGDTVLNDIRVDENIPDGLIYDSFIGSNWTGDGKTFRYNGSLDVGESVELIIVVNTTRSGIFKNMVTVGSDKTDSVDANASVRVYTPLLAVREIANNPVAVVGESVSFTVVVTNVGDCELSGIYTVNNFPEGLIYIGYEGGSWSKLTSGLLGAEASGWTQDGNKFAYSGTLKSGESANYTLFFDTTVTGTFTPEVIASSDLTASAYSNNTTVVIAPSVKVEKTSDKDSVKVGDAVRFTITVTNNGSCDAKGVFIIENAPAALALRSYYDNVNWTIDGNRFIYNGILAPNESVKLIVTYEALRAGKVTNVAVAGADNARDVNDTCVISIAPKPVPIDADLIVIKEADRHTVKVGDLIRFTITLINNGNCDLGGLFVVEKPSRHLEFVSFEGDDWIKVGNKFIYLGTLAPTDMIELVVIFRAVSDGEATNVVIAGSNMTGNESDMVFIDIEEGHGNETPSYHKQSASRMYETGNPVMLLLLAVIAIIPIKGRKH